MEECRSFLGSPVRTGKLATMRKDGRPSVVPVWFDLEGETLVFTTWHKSIKAASIRRDPRVCLCVDDETPPFAYVQVEGTAVMSDDADMVIKVSLVGKDGNVSSICTRDDDLEPFLTWFVLLSKIRANAHLGRYRNAMKK